jgi:hypothetical protein
MAQAIFDLSTVYAEDVSRSNCSHSSCAESTVGKLEEAANGGVKPKDTAGFHDFSFAFFANRVRRHWEYR